MQTFAKSTGIFRRIGSEKTSRAVTKAISITKTKLILNRSMKRVEYPAGFLFSLKVN